jgi:Trypsin
MNRAWMLAAVLGLSAASVASAQPTATQNTGGISMKPVRALNQSGTGPKVIGGRPARTQDWPASFYSSAEGARCTATLVGPRALLLAAHCVGNGQEAVIEVGGQQVSGKCTHAREYRDGAGDPSADYTLCRLGTAISGIKFESVSLDPVRLKKNQPLLLTGYGCTAAPEGRGGPTGGNDGVYRIGESKIVALPGELNRENNTILTRDEIMVCPGDSGGGAYLMLTASKRLVVSVNSRVWFQKRESYLSSLSSPDALAFLASWMKEREKICGVNLQGSMCR